MQNRIFKYIIFLILIILLILIIIYGIFGLSISYLTPKEIKENRILKEDLVKEITINNLPAIYDNNDNIFYYNISDQYENKKYSFKLELENDLKYKIINYKTNIIKVNYNKKIKVIIFNDKYYTEKIIQLTNLPLINITTNYNITDNDVKANFNYINYNDMTNVNNNIKIRVRGASSKNFDKKSYKINFYNKNYNNEKNISFSNFYEGDSLILDAIYRDPSKIRNLFATELWNDFSNDFSNINMYSEFVEVFINNEYVGLYILTEPINRKKLNLFKTSHNDTSIVIKANEKIKIDKISDIDTDVYSNHELKYPNDEEFYEKAWHTFLSTIKSYYNDEKIYYEDVKNTYNLKNYIDIIIFNAFTNNVDNRLERNNYLYMNSLNSDEIYIQPWDMEYTFGLGYSVYAERYALKNMNDSDKIYTIFNHKKAPEINKLLIDRYWELREDILTEEYMFSIIDKYKNKLSKGSSKRDSKLWYEYDLEKEIEEIKEWIKKRIEFFDEYVKELEDE